MTSGAGSGETGVAAGLAAADPLAAESPADEPAAPARDQPAGEQFPAEPSGESVVMAAPRPRWLVGLLVALIAVALVAIGGAVTVMTGLGQPYRPTDQSTDAGFTRDMITHHDQAVQMAQVARDHSTDPAVRLIAFDIETQQLGQIGQMRGWLQTWQLSEQTDRAHMAWMGDQAAHQHDAEDGALMPGMATTTEMTKLRSLSGKVLDVFFLQLIIRHHQGGLPMARYASGHVRVDYVQELAGKIVSAQTNEIVTMEQMLRERGGTPLPAP